MSFTEFRRKLRYLLSGPLDGDTSEYSRDPMFMSPTSPLTGTPSPPSGSPSDKNSSDWMSVPLHRVPLSGGSPQAAEEYISDLRYRLSLLDPRATICVFESSAETTASGSSLMLIAIELRPTPSTSGESSSTKRETTSESRFGQVRGTP
jgi:hypothetical protein